MELHPIFQFLFSTFTNIWSILFETKTLFGVSFGIIILGVTVCSVLWSVIMLALGINVSDFSSLGSPKDYFRKKRKEKEAYSRAEERFRSKHHGKLVEFIGESKG